jgi:PAS domain S-box-containing protein
MAVRRPDSQEPSIYRRLLEILGTATAYYMAARLGLLLAFTYKNISPVWPPSGVALAALLFFRLRTWPGIAAAAFLANYTTGLSVFTSSQIAVGNTLEGLIGAFILQRSGKWFNVSLTRVQDILWLILVAAFSPIAASTIGPSALISDGSIEVDKFLPACLTWWLGDGMGILVVGSALLPWFAGPLSLPRPPFSAILWRALELSILALSLFAVTTFVFGVGKEYPYAIFPVLVWAALRFGPRGASFGVLFVTGVAVSATLNSQGPFIKDNLAHSLIYLQTFLAALSATTLLLAASIEERREVEDTLRESDRRFRQALEHSDITVYSQDRDLRYTWIYDGKGRFDPDLVLGRSDLELALPEDAEKLSEIKRRVMETGVGERHQVSVKTLGQAMTFDLVVDPIVDSKGRISGVRGVATDITAIKQYQNQIETLNERLRSAMRETHHRVKNNLQIIAAMVDMRLMEGAENIPAAEMKRLAVHTQTLAAVHDLLTKEADEEGLAQSVSVKLILEKLVKMLQATSMGRPLILHVDDVRLPTKQATSLCIIISELVGNAVKHGSGQVHISFHESGDSYSLEVTDQGSGFPEEFELKRSWGTGLELVENLCRWDLGGEVVCSTVPSGGGRITITFPPQSLREADLLSVETEH